MGSVGSARRSTLLACLIGALLVGIVSLAWLAFGPQATVRGIVDPQGISAERIEPNEAGVPRAPQLPSSPEPTGAAAPPAMSLDTGRVGFESNGPAQAQFEVLVRTKDQGTPLPGCEVIFFERGAEVENELEQLVSRNGFDLGALRRVARHTFADENGFVRLPADLGRLVALAISPTHYGSEQFETDSLPKEQRSIDCTPTYFVRAQVVDEQGRPQAGVPICIAKQERGFVEFNVVATTRGPEGLAEIGPLESGDHEPRVLRLAGAFPSSAGVELNPDALPPQPIRLVLPSHGAIDVRLIEADGRPFQGAADVELESADDGTELHGQAPEWVVLRTGTANFPLIGLGLELRAKVRVPGRDRSYEVTGHGPKSAGEQALLEVRLDAGSLTLFGRAFDVERRALRFRELRLIGAVQVHPPQARQFDQRVNTDAVGNFALTLDTCRAQGAAATLLIVLEREAHSLGTVKPLVVSAGPNDLGAWTLEPAALLASGRVVEPDGADAPGITVELQNPARPLGISWAEPSRSTEQGKFELRGWSSESKISILAGSRGARLRQPILIAKGSAEVVLQRAGSLPGLRNP